MLGKSLFRRLLLGLSTGLALAVIGISLPVVGGALTPAYAQVADEFVAALEPYGHWIRQAPYGEVWVPDGLPPDWRPYEYGYWVYTDEWGWYWVSDDTEEDWGWVTYHYGRWAFDPGIGWFWIPGDEWAPAWVDWRYGDDYVGWAPLPPDDLIEAYSEQPDYWVFVPLRYIGESRLRIHYLPPARRVFLLRQTRIVNRPVRIEGRRLWVNPGLAPGFISGRTHVPLHAYQVRPRVFGATAGVQGAVTVRREDLRTRGAVRRAAPITVERSVTTIQPITGAPAPQPLGKGERGRLGPHPLGAVQGVPQQQQLQQQQQQLREQQLRQQQLLQQQQQQQLRQQQQQQQQLRQQQLLQQQQQQQLRERQLREQQLRQQQQLQQQQLRQQQLQQQQQQQQQLRQQQLFQQQQRQQQQQQFRQQQQQQFRQQQQPPQKKPDEKKPEGR